MRVLVTGGAGMLGTDVAEAARAAGMDAVPCDLRGSAERMDITDAGSVQSVLARVEPDVVIHCAAMTDVDGCERDPDAAYRVNAWGAWCVASECSARDIPLCAISTDFVFDGGKGTPYVEYDVPGPLGQYAASKLAGEGHVRSLCRRAWVVRTAWLFGVHGRCFPDTILRLAQRGDPLKVVADQVGSPTYTADLAPALLRLVVGAPYGTYHITNSGEASWYDLASEALRVAGLGQIEVRPIRAADWPTPTARPARSVLRNLALEMQGLPLLPDWRDAVRRYVAQRAAMSGSKRS